VESKIMYRSMYRSFSSLMSASIRPDRSAPKDYPEASPQQDFQPLHLGLDQQVGISFFPTR